MELRHSADRPIEALPQLIDTPLVSHFRFTEHLGVEPTLNVDLRQIVLAKADPKARVSDADAPFTLIHLLNVQPVIKEHFVENALIL
jgi:hypothetical protein